VSVQVNAEVLRYEMAIRGLRGRDLARKARHEAAAEGGQGPVPPTRGRDPRVGEHVRVLERMSLIGNAAG
jgi:hypothetical protein